MRILYIGTKSFKAKKIKSVIETLEPLFKEFVEIKTCSDKKNTLIKFFDIIYFYFIYGLISNKILIDVYSTNAFYYAFIISILSIKFRSLEGL